MIFTTDMVIRGFHIDANGHVNNARWVELLEEARWRWLAAEIDLVALRERGQGPAVIHLDVSYRKAAHVDDDIEFRCWITRLGGRSAVCHQEAWRQRTAEKVLEADVTFLMIDIPTGRVLPMAGEVRDMFAKYQLDEDET